MNKAKELMLKINSLYSCISYLDFKDRWNDEDYNLDKKTKKEIKQLEIELNKLLAENSDQYVCGKYKNDDCCYITDNYILCYSFEPTWFESKEELKKQIEITQKENQKTNIDVEIITYKEYIKNKNN